MANSCRSMCALDFWSGGTLAPTRLCFVTTALVGSPGNSGGSHSCSGPHFHLCCHINSEAVPAHSPAHPHSHFGLREEQIQLPPHVHQQLQALLKSIWYCSNVLLWLLRHHRLHRSAWKSFRQSIWDRMQLLLVNLRPGTSV